jgi:hypothetical protein
LRLLLLKLLLPLQLLLLLLLPLAAAHLGALGSSACALRLLLLKLVL